MKTPTVSEMNKTIHEFMNGKWTLIADTRGGSISHIDFFTPSFEKCEKTAQFHNRHAEYTYRVVPHIKGCDYEFHYHDSFDALMPVVRKITKLYKYKYRKWRSLQNKKGNFDALSKHLENADIRKSHKAVYQFIRWYIQYTGCKK